MSGSPLEGQPIRILATESCHGSRELASVKDPSIMISEDWPLQKQEKMVVLSDEKQGSDCLLDFPHLIGGTDFRQVHATSQDSKIPNYRSNDVFSILERLVRSFLALINQGMPIAANRLLSLLICRLVLVISTTESSSQICIRAHLVVNIHIFYHAPICHWREYWLLKR